MKKVLITLGVVILLIVVGGVSYAYYLYHSVKSTANNIYEPVGNHTTSLSNKKPISILLMGVDERPNDRGRSDTLIYMTLNPKTNKMVMMSIPRDTRTEIAGRGTINKINAAYAYGGTEMAMNTVEKFLDVPVDYYIKMNMEGLSKLVDAVGGVTVYNNISWHDEGYYKKGYYYKKGNIELDGAKALGYVRMRHLDPRGDFGRNERQRDVIMAIVNKASSISSVSRYNNILDAIQGNVKTNLTFDEMKSIAENYRGVKNNVENYELKGQGTKINGIYYFIVGDQEKQKVHNMIMEQLGER
ncbi:LCP family protein required for cell wall assembly [Scopulibacillus daqui]|uniref:LCP family protein required for cell wall assembly n=1 Tax=Scopulibacillus daqui TaxID=1469162 RepID=A0ABS2Q4W1_9BACL|nr:LCP family protein [Scopulibacillus daqui]MBM7646990.1 LCP family protein required for cell wall assembly [Scopulibacillus daqui]